MVRGNCAICGKLTKANCSLCQTNFCSEECQTAGWEDHKETCLTIAFGHAIHFTSFLSRTDPAVPLIEELGTDILCALNKIRDGEAVPNKVVNRLWRLLKMFEQHAPLESHTTVPNPETCRRMLVSFRALTASQQTAPQPTASPPTNDPNANFMRERADYIQVLKDQGPGNMNICPTCFETGKRKKLCDNPVLVPGGLACCYLGDEKECSKRRFRKKVREMKRFKKSKK